MKSKLIFSCHADTGFLSHCLRLESNGDYNTGIVTAKAKSVKSATEAIIRLAKTFSGEN